MGLSLLACLVLLPAGCDTSALPDASPGLELQQEDYATARAGFKTRLLRRGPSPQDSDLRRTPPEAVVIGYRSGELDLNALADKPPDDGKRRPAVLFLHGGFAFGEGDWEMPQPFRDAGYFVMIPLLRGENGQAGEFTLFYDEVGDVLAAADALARLPYVDPDRIYLAGHSSGGTLAMLAAMASDRFRAAASLSGGPDQMLHTKGQDALVVFDKSDPREFRVRSPVAYATSFKSPARLYYGSEEGWADGMTRRTAILAKQAGRDVDAVKVPGDHFSSVPEAMKRSLEFFRKP
jgi:dipeptidyl aminopeptidase/acylaminoacyl peptidase